MRSRVTHERVNENEMTRKKMKIPFRTNSRIRPFTVSARVASGSCIACSFATVALGAALAGCAAKPPPQAQGPGAAAPAPASSPMAASSVPSSPTASAVHIDETILKACGIQAPKAHFAFDSANVQAHDTTLLEQVAQCFSTGALKGRTMKIVGHADPRGETEYNFVLGNSRADAIGGFLRSKGVKQAQTQTTSRGELDATGTDEFGWAKDRRVDILLAQK
jgi:peptidoglycan-associated lipoprotein